MSTMINKSTEYREFEDFHPDITSSETEYGKTPLIELETDEGSMPDALEKLLETAMAAEKKFKADKGAKIYQWNTKNKSFIELHNDLAKLGVKNNKFFLRIYDETLLDVDPYGLVMPLEIQARILLECIRNPWYFLREICRIPVDGKPICPGGGVSFKLDRNNLATWYLFINGIDHYSSKPRQQGKTQDALAKLNYSYLFGCMSATIALSNKDFTLNKMNLSRLKTQRDLLPLFLQMKVMFDMSHDKEIKETSNVLSMGNPINKNKVILLPSASTAAKAEGVGRGYTAAIFMYDEFDWTPHNMAIYYASSFTYRTAADNAKKNGSMFGRIFTSTPGNMDTTEGQAADLFINGDKDSDSHAAPMLKWKDAYFDTPIQQFRSIVNSKSYNGIVFVEHSWKQLKCTNEWYENACRGVNYNEEQIAREILLMRLRGSDRSPFKRQQLVNLLNNVEKPIDQIDYSTNLSPFYIYEELVRATPYIISIDPAEGLRGDNLAMIVINPYTEKTVVEFVTPYVNQTKFSYMLVKFMDKYCPRAMIVIENNRGRELINRLLETKYSANLWFDQDKLDKKETDNKRDFDIEAERAIGFNTNTTSRNIVMATLETIVIDEPEKANSKLVVEDICALERYPTGTVKAAKGKHDDLAMAFSIGHTVLRSSRNLSSWGIIRGMQPPKKVDLKDPNYKKTALKSIFESLPDNLKSIFMESVAKSPDTEFLQHRKEVRQEAALTRIEEASKRAEYDGSDVDADLLDDVENIDAALDSQFFETATYNPDSKFDLSDYY